MRLAISVILISFVASVSEFFFPWWAVAFAAFAVAWVLKLKGGQGLIAGFVGILVFWLPVIVFKDYENHHILAQKMAELFFKSPNYVAFVVCSLLPGCIVGALGGLTGALLRKGD